MIEVLFSFGISLIIVTSLFGMYRTISHAQNISQYDEDIFIAAKQISQEVLGTNYEDVGEQYSFYNYDGEIMTFDIDNHRLVKTPGFEIMITNIDDLSFEMKHDMIYMNVVRNEKEYQFLLTFAKEKQEIDDEIITEQ
ncbi:hypothetical protein [Candidatus Stoquefichus sp. SB1]|uniref:hypothetical protein n=1 Tax=Candidatus Stoquefichus sp. SB1 TaxID=1658109 RepID=UPI000A8CB157|nr:hypothetical protein [Candidatus Stoquefichus sp. SB1]